MAEQISFDLDVTVTWSEFREHLVIQVDDERPIGKPYGGGYIGAFIGDSAFSVDDRIRVVHVISKPAKGEIRGYVWIGDELRLRLPARPGDWPALDAYVAHELGARVVPYRLTVSGMEAVDG